MGEGLRQHLEAVQAFIKRFVKRSLKLVIENCSSGGHRLEPSMMELASMASFSDAHEQKEIPIIAANLHRAILPSTDEPLKFFNIELNRQRFKSQYQDRKASAIAEPAFPFGCGSNSLDIYSGLTRLSRGAV